MKLSFCFSLVFLAEIRVSHASLGGLRQLRPANFNSTSTNDNSTSLPDHDNDHDHEYEDLNSGIGEYDFDCDPGGLVCSGDEICCDDQCVADRSLCTQPETATDNPTEAPTSSPTEAPSGNPTGTPSNAPSNPPTSMAPSNAPSMVPTLSPPPPPNDLCVNAQGPLPITASSLDGSVEITALGTTIGATRQDSPAWCGSTPISSANVWYTVVGNGKILAATTCWPGTELDTKISVFKGSCGNLACVLSNDDVGNAGGGCPDKPFSSYAKWRSEIGVTYYLLVHGFTTKIGNFEINVQGTNEQCEYAPQVPPGVVVASDTTGAIFPFGGVLDNCDGTGLIGEAPAVWFQVRGTGGRMQAKVCPEGGEATAARPFKLHIFEASCDDYGSCMGGDDPRKGCALYEWESNSNTPYYILVHNYAQPSAGNFELGIVDMDGIGYNNNPAVGRSGSDLFD
ncbi:expressed unknown protein [Seminavis robusta]|uniref:Uncharacterized protein n=1 Tax=Seminavis robusta TaxID=568900 RepID=A0A9N8D9B3_9STRA|nr:expressed unknown protein [Seminavis robusta]|eukprot:Sro7_g005890.1 n/a (453) ;mRNA; f:79981-81432